MNTKHTPGPWQIKTGNGWAHTYIEDASGKTVAKLEHFSNNCNDCTLDARLIAAAPDLLAALIGLDEAFCSLNDNMTREERHDARLKLIAARAAVAKATGKEPA